MPPFLIPALKFGLPIAAQFFGGLFGGEGRQTKETRQTGTRQDQGFAENFFSDPRAQQFSGNLFNRFENQFDRDLPINEQAIDDFALARTGAVNRGFEGAGRNLQASLADRGLSFSPGPQGVGFGQLAAARGGALADVGGDIARLRFDLPQMQERIRQERFKRALELLRIQPRGQRTDTTRTLDLTTTGEGRSRFGNRFADAIGGAIGGFNFDREEENNIFAPFGPN